MDERNTVPAAAPRTGAATRWVPSPYLPRAARVDNAARDAVPDTGVLAPA